MFGTSRNVQFNPDTYTRWRSRFPWTDAQFAQVYDERATAMDADGNDFVANKYRRRATQIRLGHLSAYDLRFCLDALITVCACCGKKALYRYGKEGRCSMHRLVTTPGFEWWRQQMEQRRTVIEQQLRETDAADKAKRRLAKTFRSTRRPVK